LAVVLKPTTGPHLTDAERQLRQPLEPRSLRDGVAADRRAGDEAEREHSKQRPARWLRRLVSLHKAPCGGLVSLRKAPHGGLVPLPRPGPQVSHEVAGFVPRGAVMIRMSITRPQPITA